MERREGLILFQKPGFGLTCPVHALVNAVKYPYG
jgi:hypothetical protein